METDGSCNAVPAETKLYAKMAKVMGIINRVPKSGNNSFHKYRYATADDVADTIREAMAEVNLALIVQMGQVKQETIEYESSSKTTKTIRTTVDFKFIFACGDSGAVVIAPWTSQVDDNSDKAINKCATSAEKYFLMKTFIVSAGDEPDSDADKHREEAGKKVTTPYTEQKWHEPPGILTGIAEKAYANQWITEKGNPGVKQLERIIAPKTWDDFTDKVLACEAIKATFEDTLAELAAQHESEIALPTTADLLTLADPMLIPEAPKPIPDIPTADARALLNGGSNGRRQVTGNLPQDMLDIPKKASEPAITDPAAIALVNGMASKYNGEPFDLKPDADDAKARADLEQ